MATLVRHPSTFAGAVLLRPVMAFENPPETNLDGLNVLVLHGQRDPFLPLAEPVTPYLRRMHGDVQEQRLEAGHELTAHDLAVAAEWLREQVQHLAGQPGLEEES